MTTLQSLWETMRRAVTSPSSGHEILSLPDAERKLLAQDLHIGEQDFARLIPGDLGPDKQLPSRLQLAGLSASKTSAKYGAVMQDMERVCSLCNHQRRCAKDLKEGREHHIESYCPNSSTIDALAGEPALSS